MNETPIECTRCGTQVAAQRMPRGWKRCDESVLCGPCVKHAYVLRAVTIPVVGPLDGTWEDLRVALRGAWKQTTAISNWLINHYYAADTTRIPGMDKLPPMPRVYLYPAARAAFPDFPTQSLTAIDHAILGKYRSSRFDVIWRSAAALPTFRYPAPLPVPAQGWSLGYTAEGRPRVSARIGDRRWDLLLRGGHSFRRQLAGFAAMADGAAMRGQLVLFARRAHAADHRSGVPGRDENGRGTVNRVLCKLVGYFPRQQRDLTGTLLVRTDPDCLLVALNAKDERLWVEHADQAARWAAEHRRKIQRWADDQKAEQRPVASFQGRRSAAARKYHDRMDSLVHEVSAHLVNYARRRRFAALRYDDTERSYGGDGFPWAALATAVQYKCDAAGIIFDRSNDEKDADGARDPESAEDC